MPRRRSRRRSRRYFGVAGIVSLLVLLLLWFAVPIVVQGWVMRALDEAGLGPVRLKLAWDGPFGFTSGPLRLGASGALSADAAAVSFSPAGLAAGRLDRLRLSGLHLAATIDKEGGIVIADLPPLTAPAGGSAPIALPVDRIILDQARLDAATPAGPVALGLDATITSGPAGLALDGALGVTIGALHLTLPDLALAPTQAGGWHLHLAHAEASDAEHGLALADIAADAAFQAGVATLNAEIGRLADATSPARFPPLAVKIAAKGPASHIDFTAEATDAAGHVRLSAKGRHDVAAGRGSAEVSGRLQPFQANGLQPRDLSPGFAKALPPIEGRLALGGGIDWTGASLKPRLALSLADLGGRFGAALLSGGHGTLLLDSLAPPATPPGQHVAANLTVGDLEQLPVEARFQLRRDGMLVLESLSAGLADGTLATRDILFKPAEGLPRALPLPVEIANVELGALLKLVAVEGLSGEGRLDGTLPLRLATDASGARHVLLQQGRLAGRGAGVLRYGGAGLPEQGAGSGAQSVALLRQVLKDFHYRSLSAELDQATDGSGGILLHLDGSNPAVLGGRRFLLNIRLEANFDRLAQIFLSGLEAAQTLTRNSLDSSR